MKSVRELIKNNKYLLLLLYMPIYLAAFFIIDNLNVDHYIINCSLDSLIPFNEWFIIPYSLWFIWFPGVAAFFLWHSLKKNKDAKADFIKLCIVMFTSMSISLIIYVIFPNGIALREPIERTNIAAELVKLIRAADTPYGVCPSIHVATIVAEALVIKDSRLKAVNRGLKYFSYLVTLLIMYSTMAVKQHSIVDVAAGAVLAAVIYLIYTIPRGAEQAGISSGQKPKNQ